MKYLLDTCIVSETIRKNPNARVIEWLCGLNEFDLFISALTIGEIRKGVVKMPEGTRKEFLSSWLDRLVKSYEGRVVYVTTAVADLWGKCVGLAEMKGKPRPSIDSLIAVSALANDMTLVTRNESDFAYLGVNLVNPFK